MARWRPRVELRRPTSPQSPFIAGLPSNCTITDGLCCRACIREFQFQHCPVNTSTNSHTPQPRPGCVSGVMDSQHFAKARPYLHKRSRSCNSVILSSLLRWCISNSGKGRVNLGFPTGSSQSLPSHVATHVPSPGRSPLRTTHRADRRSSCWLHILIQTAGKPRCPGRGPATGGPCVADRPVC